MASIDSPPPILFHGILYILVTCFSWNVIFSPPCIFTNQTDQFEFECHIYNSNEIVGCIEGKKIWQVDTKTNMFDTGGVTILFNNNEFHIR